ncbi:sidestep VIII [Carabus blaptoides fortunei]
MWLVAWAGGVTATTETAAEALLGSSAGLVCDLTPAIPGDHVSLVIWYREDEDAPVYTYDVRVGNAGLVPVPATSMAMLSTVGGSHWADRSLGDRAYMRVTPTDAKLTLDPVQADDEGTYRCRADFRRSPTKTSNVNLTVIVPPREIVVTDDSGNPVKNGVTMQYAEGASASLSCVASGGRPLPRVSWWRNGLQLDDTDTVSSERQRTRNVLHIERLSRRDLLTVYLCEASNSQTQPPLQVPIAIDMYLRPLDVRLLGDNMPLSAGSVHEISCRTHGSRPPANVTWYKDGLSLGAETRDIIAEDGNSTTSILSLKPLASDSGMTLQCRVHNIRIPNSELRDTWMLHVLYKPEVGLTLGASLNGSNIREGADVYFECHITANPWVHRVAWTHDGRRLVNNVTAGIIVSNQTLVLQSVSKTTSGIYTCIATNTEGSRDSNPIHLDVKYEPVCGKNPQRVFGAAKQEQVSIECKVDANPVASIFRWTFNNTASSSVNIHTFSVEDGGGRSILTYTPHMDSDYGTLLCWGKNALGSQAIPCVFHIVPAGRPDPPHNCTTSNRTHHSFAMTCTRGFDGGLRQRFSLLVRDERESLVLNVTSGAVPEFTVTGLEPGREYRAMGFAYNEKGWSRGSVPIVVATMPQPNLHEQRRSTAPTTTVTVSTGAWPYVALGLVVTLLLAGILGGLAARRDGLCCARTRPIEGAAEVQDVEAKSRQRPTIEPKSFSIASGGMLPPEEAADPDLILLTTGDPYCQHAYGAYTISTGSSAGVLNTCLPPCLATATTSSINRHNPKRNCATQMPLRPYHVTWGPDIQIHDELPVASPPPPPAELCVESIRRNVQTQTQPHPLPPPQPQSPAPPAAGHKESSV